MDIESMKKKLEDYEKPFVILHEFIKKNQTSEAINYIKDYFNCDEETAKEVFIEFKVDHDVIFTPSKKLSDAEIAYNNMLAQSWLNQPKCPTCGSKNLKKISTVSKAVNTAMFGIWGTKRNKTFHCNNCGYEW